MLYSGFGGAGLGYSGFGGGYASPYSSYGGGLSGYSSGQLFTSAPQFAQYGGFQQAYAQPASPMRSGVLDYDKNLIVVSPSTGGYSSYGGYQSQPQVRQQIAVSPQPQSYSGYGFGQQFSSYGGYGGYGQVSPQVYQQSSGQLLQRSPSGLSGFSSGLGFGSAAAGGQQFQAVQPQQQQQQVRALPSSTPGAFQIPRVNAVAQGARPNASPAPAAAPRPAAPPSNDGDIARDYWGRPLNGAQAPPPRPGLANSARTGERAQDWKHLMTGENK